MSTVPTDAVIPVALTNSKRDGVLTVAWSDGSEQLLTSLQARQRCRCSECESARRSGTPVQVNGLVRIEQINTIGSYGVQFVFSDGHERGIYPWQYLRTIGREEVAQT